MRTFLKNQTIDEIVFENRNKAYGAYFLRINYSYHLTKALFIALSIMIFFLGSAFSYSKYFQSNVSKPDGPIYEVQLPPRIETPNEEVKKPIAKVPDQKAVTQRTVPTEIVTPVLDDVVKIETTATPNDDIGDLPVSNVPNNDPAAGNIGTTSNTIAATPLAKDPEPATPDILVISEVKPEFPGGDKELYKFLMKNLSYPNAAVRANVEGKVYVKFVVEKDGSIGNLQILKSVGFGCDEEALRVLKSMPSWSPGKQNGKAVRVYYTMPIVFKFG
jgi:periplasmic protein TonB